MISSVLNSLVFTPCFTTIRVWNSIFQQQQPCFQNISIEKEASLQGKGHDVTRWSGYQLNVALVIRYKHITLWPLETSKAPCNYMNKS